jgi:endoglucanase
MRTNTTISALLLLLTLAGCGGNSSTGSSPGAAATPAPTLLAKPTKPPTTTSYPSYNISPQPADMTGMSSNAVQLAAKFKLGWNLGNTLEATGGETNWGNPVPNAQLFQAVKAAGFTAVRLPVSWDQYANQTTGKISDTWLNHIKQVTQYCVDNGLYVVVNIHWDGGWLDAHINSTDQAAVNAKQKAFWEQIATTLRDFDEHVMFASANEPPANTAATQTILMSYHQTFVNAVRSTGGKNAYRVLVVQGPTTSIDLTTSLMNSQPTDTVANRQIVEVHYYDPAQFAFLTSDASWGKMYFYWGTGYHSTTDTNRNAEWGEEAYVDAEFAKMKTKFTSKGIPVILGEFGAIRRTSLTGDNLTLHLNSRAYYLNYITKAAVANGMQPFYWDNGYTGDGAFGLFNRSTGAMTDQKAMDAMIRGVNGLNVN